MQNIFENKEQLKKEIQVVLREISGKENDGTSPHDIYRAVQTLLLRKIMPSWNKYTDEYAKEKEVYYFSIEILIGRLLGSNLISLNAEKVFEEVLQELNVELNLIEEYENEPGLGNGGLGRLFACFLESMATLGIPGHGVSLFYRTGLMRQSIDPETGRQIANPDHWDTGEHLGMIHKSDEMIKIAIGGELIEADENGSTIERVINSHYIHIIPWYVPVIGYQKKINNLILLSTDVSQNLDNDVFDTYLQGDIHTNPFWKVMVSLKLYPSAKQDTGKWLRFVQEAVLAIGGLKLILNKKINALFPDTDIEKVTLKQKQKIIREVFDKLVFQINDTHPALLVPAIMQILLDDYRLDWEESWKITHSSLAYTNHTVRPEALETWEIDLFRKVLPRHYSIVEQINTNFRHDVKNAAPDDAALLQRTEAIDHLSRRINMARLAIMGAHSVNGVARLHSDILKADLFKDFYQIYPDKFNNKTNGITHRRFLLKANPELSELLDQHIGTEWRSDCNQFKKINDQKLADNDDFIKAFRKVKQTKKQQLASYIEKATGQVVNPESMFDSHVKRFHEYKRQLMKLLHILVLTKEVQDKPQRNYYPRTFIFAGKSPEDYYEAKLTIQCVKYARDKAAELKSKLIDVVFIPNYNVTWAERIFTGSDLSEQIPKAGQEASGTGLFKALFNGALIVGTHDGANIEVAEAVGDQNIFLFGTKVNELNNPFDPQAAVNSYEPLAEVLNDLKHHPEFNLFYRQLIEYGDPWAILRDFMEYYALQEDLIVPFYYKHPDEWNQKAVRAMGAAGDFSSDRTIRQYAKEIWKL
ncbi:MAG: glycogen/starch/alpha-glucan family phosphorylase [Candidatus Margulisiibacteriota bacterium]